MTRLPRSRKGKTAIDVIVTQQGQPRVRLSMSRPSNPGLPDRFVNTDMDEQEVNDLIVLLQFKLAVMRGEVAWDDD